jgi:hypothetical protein
LASTILLSKFAEDSGLTGQHDQSGYNEARAMENPVPIYCGIRIGFGQTIVKEFQRNSASRPSLTGAFGRSE